MYMHPPRTQNPTMRLPQALLVIGLSTAATLLFGSVGAYNTAAPPRPPSVLGGGGGADSVNTRSRRSVLATGLLTAAGILTGAPQVARAEAEASSSSAAPLESVYFGVGCFWHIQHEFVKAERTMLGRSDAELTSLTGYAGGKAVGSEGRVCYHNLRGVADYGKLGHGEVVGLQLPQDKIVEFSRVYFSLFNPKTGDRVDPQDKGPEYRSLVGLPGGTSHAVYPGIEEAAKEAGFKLSVGRGNDPDTLGNREVFVYDTAKFPFYQAEVYHQFHNDFQEPPYGKEYNALADAAFEDGRIKMTGCPDRV